VVAAVLLFPVKALITLVSIGLVILFFDKLKEFDARIVDSVQTGGAPFLSGFDCVRQSAVSTVGDCNQKTTSKHTLLRAPLMSKMSKLATAIKMCEMIQQNLLSRCTSSSMGQLNSSTVPLSWCSDH
jgi:hypothetical protein